MTDHDAERRDLREAIQKVLNEHEGGPYLIGWDVTFEVSAPDGARWLMHRNGGADGRGLPAWQALGYLHSSLNDVDDQDRGGRIEAEDDE